LLIVAAVVLLVGGAMTVAMGEDVSGTYLVFLVPAVPYVLFTVMAVLRMRREGTLAEAMRPRSGDLTFGAIVAAMLYFGALAGRTILAPHGSAREGWLIRIYQQVGDPEVLQRHMIGVSLAVVLVAALEEITWRGLVYPLLEEKIGTRRAWPATAVLYAAAHVPTALMLRDPFAGPNPLVVFAALGCGLVWGLVVARTGRLPVAIISHALFTWGVVVQFPLWRLQ
jgi:membrane protease YdiL (CAAX protease family)